jgi:hypothetical protein
MITQLMCRQGAFDLAAEYTGPSVACTTCKNSIIDFTFDPEGKAFLTFCQMHLGAADRKPLLATVARADALLCGPQALSYVRGGGLVRVDPEDDMAFAI